MNIAVPDLTSVIQHAGVARFLALQLEQQGHRTDAVAWLEVVVVVGWQLQQEPLLVIDMVGVKLAADAAEQLSDLWKRAGENEVADRWRALSGLFRSRRYDDWKDLPISLNRTSLETLTDSDVEQLAALAETPGRLPGTRTEAMLYVAAFNLMRPGSPPPSDRQRELFGRWVKMDDARMASVTRYLARTLDLSAADRLTVAREVGESYAPAR